VLLKGGYELARQQVWADIGVGPKRSALS
jgi:hypothetical protein